MIPRTKAQALYRKDRISISPATQRTNPAIVPPHEEAVSHHPAHHRTPTDKPVKDPNKAGDANSPSRTSSTAAATTTVPTTTTGL